MPFPRKLLVYGSIAACLCLLLLGSICMNVYARPASYISIDVNPSMEICINKWNRVIDVIPYNEDAERICSQLNLKNKYYTDAIEELLCNKDFQTYCMNQKPSDLTFTIVSENCEKLQTGIESCPSYSLTSGTIHHASNSTASLAHENNCSIGKYAAYEELSKYDSSVTLNDCLNMTMHELHNEIESHHDSSHDSSHGNGYDNGYYNGYDNIHDNDHDENNGGHHGGTH